MRRSHTVDQADRVADAPGPASSLSPGPSSGSSSRTETLRTEFPFELPRGYVDGSGTVHRSG